MARKYQMKARAEKHQGTRRRIVEAAVHLHGTVGPALTNFNAVAGLAGLPRQTVYRHFADEAALFGACSAHFLQANPPPDPVSWLEETNPQARLGVALTQVYSYYEGNHRMLANVLRDAALVPSLQAFVAPYELFRAAARDLLAEGWTGDEDRVRSVIGLALTFDTWRTLSLEQGLPLEGAVELMVVLAAAVARHQV
jgi:AcrR family transcriptional regulator